jgi:hypothetical protein
VLLAWRSAISRSTGLLGDDAELGVLGPHRGLGEEGMQLGLVDRGHGADLSQKRIEMLGLEVAHADGPDAPVGEQPLGGPVRRDGALPLGRIREVQQVEVDDVEAELASAGVERAQGGVVSPVAEPQLGGDEHVVAGDVGRLDAVSDLLLVLVVGRDT